ncbi:MAG: hypothetical protein ACI8PZ_002667 [Myxococcota bacterium]|jgi:hypothetical protein
MDLMVPTDAAGLAARFAALIAAAHFVLGRRLDLSPPVLGLLGIGVLLAGTGSDVAGWAMVAVGLCVLGWTRGAGRAVRPGLDALAAVVVVFAVGVGASPGPLAERAALVVCAATALYGGIIAVEGRGRSSWSRRVPVEDASRASARGAR